MAKNSKPKAYTKAVRHKNDQGKPAFDRGKPPHKGGFHGRKKGVNPFRIGFYMSDGTYDTVSGGHRIKSASSWNPGRSKPSTQYKKRAS